MRQKKPYLVVTFAATADAMAMERYCMERNLPGRLIPIPREIHAGCGLAWSAPPGDIAAVRALLEAAGIEAQHIKELDI